MKKEQFHVFSFLNVSPLNVLFPLLNQLYIFSRLFSLQLASELYMLAAWLALRGKHYCEYEKVIKPQLLEKSILCTCCKVFQYTSVYSKNYFVLTKSEPVIWGLLFI